MRTPLRYAAVVAAVYVVLMTALVISNYGPWGLPERFLPVELQQVLVWPFDWIAQPLLASDKLVPIWSMSGRANEAATWRELLVYNVVGGTFYALVGAGAGLLRERRRANRGRSNVIAAEP